MPREAGKCNAYWLPFKFTYSSRKMKYDMIATKPGIALSYLVAGGTSGAGAAKIVNKGQPVMDGQGNMVFMDHVHTFFGFELSEWALLMGICGTFATMLFQYLSYRNNSKRKDQDRDKEKS